ncbi:MAG: flagellar filament capping protein FliD, partial [Phycisphaerae bacterium]
RRGTIEITDSAGEKAAIDLSTALTVEDVLVEINSRTDIAVSALAEGDHLVLTDSAGGSINVRDLGGGHAAEDLGIAKNGSDGTITGDRIIHLFDGTQLSILNDGNGVSIGKLNQDIKITSGGNTFTVGLRGLLTRDTHLDVLNSGNGVRSGTIKITNRAGQSADVVVDDSIATIGDLIDAINAAGIEVSATVGALKGQLVINDNSTPADGTSPGNLKIEGTAGNAAGDLGIVADTDQTTFTGSEIYRISSLGDVIRAINYAVDATDPANPVRNQDIVAGISESGRGLELLSRSGAEFTVEAGEENSRTAQQLGLIGESQSGRFVARDVLAGLNSVLLSSLRGGRGVSLGEVKVQDAAGNQVEVDFSAAPPSSVQELIDLFNAGTEAAGVAVTARLNDASNGIIFEDHSGGSGATRLKDVGSAGRTVADLFNVDFGDVQTTTRNLDTGNTQLQYISEATRLESLNNGRGVATGRFTITASDGSAVSVNITENQTTVTDIIEVINALARSIDVEARINENGDGIEIIDKSGGGTLSITDDAGGRTAKDLNIAGAGKAFDENGETLQRIDGSFEYRVEVDADDTLDEVRAKINALGIDVEAGIVNDGSANTPFHLVVSSQVSGTRGRLLLDTGSTGLSFDTLVQAQDAVVFFGGAGAENPIILSSSTNSLSDVLEGVTINLVGTSDTPVELTITQDVDRIVSDLKTFVSNYNGVMNTIAEQTRFDAETNVRGVLFGDSTVNIILNRLRSSVTAKVPDAPPGFDRLVMVGINVGKGGRLSFDEERFRERYTENPEAVETLFTAEETGVGNRLNDMLDELTISFDGLLARRDDLLEGREELFNDRIEGLQELLARKRVRLERQFRAMETALASLQGAQSALGVVTGLAAGAFSA